MTRTQGRNDPCHCGSGKKYKNCHGGQSAVSNRTLLIGGGAIVLILAVWLGKGVLGGGGGTPAPPGAPPPGKVWSAEHGHWHDAAPGGSQPERVPLPGAGSPDTAGASSIPGLGGTPQPPGEAPPGKIWSAEHGHWHEDNAQNPGAPQPPGEPPPGKEWSVEHGHWHDAGAVPVDSLSPAPADTLPTATP